jgi:hypothetical protein
MKITDKTLEKGGEMLGRLMQSYKTKINEAFQKSEELNIGLSLKIEPGNIPEKVRLEAGINFVSERVKDTFTDQVNLIPDLFEQVDAVMCPIKKMSVLKTFCNQTCKDRTTSNPSEANKKGQVCMNFRSCAAWSDFDTKESIAAMLLAWESAPKAEKKNGKKKQAA